MPITPGAQYADEIRRIYADAGRRTISILAKHLGTGSYTEDWAYTKLGQLAKVRADIQREVIANLKVGDKLRAAVARAYKGGLEAARLDLEGAGIRGVTASFGAINERAIEAAANEVIGSLNGTHLRILRQAEDTYRLAVSHAQTSVLTGTATRREASQMVLNKFANSGVTGFVDRAGRAWNLASYSEMAVRTTTARSALNGHIDRMVENKRDLVITSSHANSCPLCRPWEGRILSISGGHPDYSSLDDAYASGMFHPSCLHSVSAYVGGLTRIPRKPEPVHGGYPIRQQQRYNERGIRRWKRREAAGLDDATRKKARLKVREWQEKQRALIDKYDLKRLYYREQITKAR